MIKNYKNLRIALIILIQSAFSIVIGLLIFFLITQKYIAPGVYIADIYVGKMDKIEASWKIEKNFSDIIENGSFDIKFNNNEKFNIKYRDISAYINSDATISKALGEDTNTFIYKFNGYFINKKNTIYPVISYNETKLKEKLGELAKLINKKSVDANIELINGKVIKTPEVEGQKLNTASAYTKLLNEIPKNLGREIEFNKGRDLEIERMLPQFSVSDFDGADGVISRYSTDIKSSEFKGSIKTAVHAINKVVLFPKDISRGLIEGTLSFNKYLAQDKALNKENNEGYNQVVSTLNAAVLSSEVDKSTIIRTLHKSTVDYIDPGLDAIISMASDYKFKNTTENVLIIFAEVKDDKVVISLVGKKTDIKAENSLEIEVVQRYDPSVVNTESQDLKPGEMKLISPGKEGIEVNVYRVTLLKGLVNKKTLLFNNIKYDSVKSIVETGAKN